MSQGNCVLALHYYRRIGVPGLLMPVLAGLARDAVAAAPPSRMINLGGKASITALAFSPNGQELIWGASNGHVWCEKLNETKPSKVVHAHGGIVRSVGYSPDGKYVCITSEEEGWAVSVPFSPQGGWYLTNAVHYRCLIFGGNSHTLYGALPNGIQMETAGPDVSSRTQMMKAGPTSCLSLAPDKQRLASSEGDKVVVWAKPPAPQKKMLLPLSEKGTTNSDRTASTVTSIAWAPNGGTIAGGYSDGAIRLWNVPTGKQLAVLEGHKEAIVFVAYLGQSHTLVSVDKSGGINFWNATTRQASKPLQTQLKSTASAALSRDGLKLAIGSGLNDDQIEILDIPAELAATSKPKPSSGGGTAPTTTPGSGNRARQR